MRISPAVPILSIALIAFEGQTPVNAHVNRISAPVAVTFVFKAPGRDERIDRGVHPPEGKVWLVVSMVLKGVQKGVCETSAIVVKSTAGESFAATGITSDTTNGFIKFEDLPPGVGRGPSAWAVFRGSSGRSTLSITDVDPEFQLLFAVPTAAAPVTLDICALGSAKLSASN